MSRFRRAGLAVIAAGALFLGACSSDGAAETTDADAPAAETSSRTPEKPGIGDRVEAEGIALTIDVVTEATEIEWNEYDDNAVDGKLKAREDGKFVLVHTTVENTWNQDFQPTCSDIKVNLHGDNDAKYAEVPNLFAYPGNKGCEGQLGVGFDEEATFIFEIPEKVAPVGFDFALRAVMSGDAGEIAIDEVPDEDDSDRPRPTRDSGAPETPERTTTTTRATTQQQAATSPVLGAPCAASQANQPGTAANGTPLVCVNMGASGFSWVNGPSPQGIGTASDGGECVNGDVGGQDDQGRMMMCVNGQWVYGP